MLFVDGRALIVDKAAALEDGNSDGRAVIAREGFQAHSSGWAQLYRNFDQMTSLRSLPR
jgi:hypothetical protein